MMRSTVPPSFACARSVTQTKRTADGTDARESAAAIVSPARDERLGTVLADVGGDVAARLTALREEDRAEEEDRSERDEIERPRADASWW
jgi:hypothetical protein